MEERKMKSFFYLRVCDFDRLAPVSIRPSLVLCRLQSILFTNLIISRSKLPTPDLSKVAVVPADDHVDDAELHGGRTRSFPHVRGDWATFVYVQCKYGFLF